MAKEFKTIEELIELMESRGILTDDSTKFALQRESYYAIINGYKRPFLNTKAMQAQPSDVYQEGTSFAWIYSLFLFDRELRSVTFKYITQAEAIMRSSIVYSFCEAHPEPNAYLQRSSFCSSNDYLVPSSSKNKRERLHQKNLVKLMETLNGKQVVGPNTRPFIKHYIKQYGFVPL